MLVLLRERKTQILNGLIDMIFTHWFGSQKAQELM